MTTDFADDARSDASSPTSADGARLRGFADLFEAITANVAQVLHGKREVIELAVMCLLAEGHLLIEDVPGVGKTSLAKALAASIDCSWKRIQFTPDLLPTDLVGVSIYQRSTETFVFEPGPLFANIVLADEINRASPKTQSALLEAMEERQITADGRSRRLESPFMVIATQNPIEMEGTYPLPEAQRDRFTARISMGYPTPSAELEMLDVHGGPSPLDGLQPVARAADVRGLIDVVRQVHVSPSV
ncbi:MAG: AAA family ATPase, partial [Acidobacteriota bacterium]